MPSLDALLHQYPFPSAIDNTMRDDWWACPHLFFRRHIQGLRVAETHEPGSEPTPHKSIHLHFGGALAAGLEETRKVYHETGSENEALHMGGVAILRAWGDSPIPTPRTRTEEAKTLEGCVLAHHGYFREWPLDDPMQQPHVVEGRPLVEFSGALPIPDCLHPTTGQPVLYVGRFDSILNRFGNLWGLDDKSTGSNVESDSWRSQWSIRSQFTGYCWLAQGWGYPVNSFLIHGIQVLKTKCNYAEAMTERPRWMVDRWLAQLKADVGKMIKQYSLFLAAQGDLQPHPFPQALGNACHHFNTPCAFLRDICLQPCPEDWLDQFVVERWDPLRVRAGAED